METGLKAEFDFRNQVITPKYLSKLKGQRVRVAVDLVFLSLMTELVA